MVILSRKFYLTCSEITVRRRRRRRRNIRSDVHIKPMSRLKSRGIDIDKKIKRDTGRNRGSDGGSCINYIRYYCW